MPYLSLKLFRRHNHNYNDTESAADLLADD
jgi:hypothetical protein